MFLVPEAPHNSMGVRGHAPAEIFEICAGQFAGNAPSSRPFCFFMLLAKRAHVIVVSLS